MPRYGKGDEVWSIAQVDKTLTITEHGKPSVRRFVSADHAAAQREKLVDARLADGWALLPPEPATPPKLASRKPERRVARNPELEAAIAANPDDLASWAVYGDWLAQHGDPRGELVALQLAAETSRNSSSRRETAREYLEEHGPELLHPLGKYFPSAGGSSLEWRRGFVRSVVLADRSDLPALLGEILVHPAFAFIESLTLAESDRDAATAAAEVLAAHPPRMLRELSLTGAFADIRAVLAALPPLRGITLAGRPLSEQAVVSLAGARLPMLERLRLDLGRADGLEPVRALLQRSDLPRLVRLGVRDCGAVHEVRAAILMIAGSPLAAQLQVLDFGLAVLWQEHGTLLNEHRARFPKLRELWCQSPVSLGPELGRLRGWIKHVLETPQVLHPDDRRYDGVRE